ncbi:MAG TPA: hypothetical protein VLH87_03890, partial [Pyrinomonadaceae bacterium]|nr:hypothetical protein [Pyrinomonadaceae bacterium]
MKYSKAEHSTQAPRSTTNYPDNFTRRLNRQLLLGLLLLLVVGRGSSVKAQACTNTGDGSSSIWAQIKDTSTGAVIADGAVLPRYTIIRLDSIATASGYCHSCPEYIRTINHIDIWMEDSTTGWDGSYSVGYVTGKNPDGTTAYPTQLRQLMVTMPCHA